MVKDGGQDVDQDEAHDDEVVVDVPAFDGGKAFPVVDEPVVGEVAAIGAFMGGRDVADEMVAVRTSEVHRGIQWRGMLSGVGVRLAGWGWFSIVATG